MTGRTARVLSVLLPVALVAAACGAGTSRTGRTVTFRSSGAFPTSTIVGRHSASGCTADARTVVRNARLYYAHSTVAPGPADLYYYDLRFAYAHFEADACTSGGLGREMRRRLTARQRTFLLGHVASDLHRALRAALNGS